MNKPKWFSCKIASCCCLFVFASAPCQAEEKPLPGAAGETASSTVLKPLPKRGASLNSSKGPDIKKLPEAKHHRSVAVSSAVKPLPPRSLSKQVKRGALNEQAADHQTSSVKPLPVAASDGLKPLPLRSGRNTSKAVDAAGTGGIHPLPPRSAAKHVTAADSTQTPLRPQVAAPSDVKPLPAHATARAGAGKGAVAINPPVDIKALPVRATAAANLGPQAVAKDLKPLPQRHHVIDKKHAESAEDLKVKPVAKVVTSKPEVKQPVAGLKPLPQHTATRHQPVQPVVGSKAAQSLPKAVPAIREVVKIQPERHKTTGSKNWTVVVGTYLLQDAIVTEMARAKNSGVTLTVQPYTRQKANMTRLFLAEFSDRNAAQSALNKLKQHTSDAFILDHAGRYAVYAGSYLLETRVASEKQRLSAVGFVLYPKRIVVALPSKRLIAGSYTDKKAAEAMLAKLKGAGFKAVMVPQ